MSTSNGAECSLPPAADQQTSRVVNASGYRGIFSSSICAMFQSPRHARTDSCALAFCGIWLWERNKFVATGEMPKSWRDRPLLLAALAIGTAYLVTLAAIRSSAVPVGDNEKDRSSTDKGDAHDSPESDRDDDGDDVSNLIASVLFAAAVVLLWVLLVQFSTARRLFRRELATKTFQVNTSRAPEANSMTDQDMGSFLRQHDYEIQHGQGLCGCYRNDVAKRRVVLHGESSDSAQGTEMFHPANADLCQKIWGLLQTLCCNCCCSCWCMYCGICATAQESRHIDRLTQAGPLISGVDEPLALWKRDYITLQPWSEYMPAITQLRNDGNGGILSHIRAMSQLSTRLLVVVGCVLGFTLIVTIFTSQPWEFFVLMGALVHPVIFLFFAYWLWNRFDISLDATVKYFASGFFICTGTAIIYEVLVQFATGIISAVVGFFSALVFVATGDVDLGPIINATNSSEGDPGDESIDPRDIFPSSFLYFNVVVGAFLNAFVVAALVEETTKYLCFYMVEHEDLRTNEEIAWEEENRTEEDGIPPPPKASYVSRGAAVTVAMMATALGFACAENLLYVFVYTPPGLQTEVATLVMRSLFPVHPIAAAMQSIGVCRRDIENDPSARFGRILLPALILHGTFDFVLMAMAGIDSIKNPHSKDEPSEDEEEMTEEDVIESMWSLGISMSIVLVGIVYYFYQARLQHKRLEFMDENRGNSGDAPVLSSIVS